MPYGYRVEKRSRCKGDSARRGRGRPVQWSESWRKRLVMLRLCGLQLAEILQVLSILSGGTLPARTRRAEQILRDLLSDGYRRYCTTNKSRTRQRITFLKGLGPSRSQRRATKQYDGLRARRRSHRTSALLDPLASTDFSVAESMPRQFNDASSSLGSSITSRAQLPSYNPEGQPLHTNSSNVPYGSLNTINEHPTSSAVVASKATYHTQATKDFMRALSRAKPTFRSNRSAQIRQLLRTASRSSSYVSDVISLLRRFSFRTTTTGTVSSHEAPSIADDEQHPAELVSLEVIHERRIKEANATIIETCCRTNYNCFHRAVLRLTLDQDKSHVDQTHLIRTLRNSHALNKPDPYGNTGFFFAARSGLPAEAFFDLLDNVYDLNFLNSDGQNFLFSLDPAWDDAFYGRCYCHSWHPLKFMCLIYQLERRNFNFDHTDHDGRTFLTTLIFNRSFSLEWINHLCENSTSWKPLIRKLASKRDCSGKFLIDYLPPNVTDNDVHGFLRYVQPRLKEYVIEGKKYTIDTLWPPLFRRHSKSNPHVEDSVSWFIQKFLTQLAWIEPEINSYIEGYTIYMRFVKRLSELEPNEGRTHEISRWLDYMKVSYGANVNSRSHDGGTTLHLLTKAARPDLLELVIQSGVNIHHRDNAGCSALDYAVEAFNYARKPSSPAGTVAAALKCIMMLVDNGAQMSFTPNTNGTTVMRSKYRRAVFIPGPLFGDTSLEREEFIHEGDILGRCTDNFIVER